MMHEALTTVEPKMQRAIEAMERDFATVRTGRASTGMVERILYGEAVHDGRQHAHVVAGRAVHALRAGRQPAEDVPAADDDRRLDPLRDRVGHLPGDLPHDTGIDPVLGLAEQCFAGQLQEHPARGRGRQGGGRIGHALSAVSPPSASAGADPPTAMRAKRATRMFSPSSATFSVMRSATF